MVEWISSSVALACSRTPLIVVVINLMASDKSPSCFLILFIFKACHQRRRGREEKQEVTSNINLVDEFSDFLLEPLHHIHKKRRRRRRKQ